MTECFALLKDLESGDPVGIARLHRASVGVIIEVLITRSPLRPGRHGFHLHEGDDIHDPGGHYDPEQTGSHQGPDGDGHRGDLPALRFGFQGRCSQLVHAKRLDRQEMIGRTLVVHEGGDTYSDTPKNGGGAKRLLAGVVQCRTV